jgi:NADH:ubiquinone oxidoreductase subunit E
MHEIYETFQSTLHTKQREVHNGDNATASHDMDDEISGRRHLAVCYNSRCRVVQNVDDEVSGRRHLSSLP